MLRCIQIKNCTHPVGAYRENDPQATPIAVQFAAALAMQAAAGLQLCQSAKQTPPLMLQGSNT